MIYPHFVPLAGRILVGLPPSFISFPIPNMPTPRQPSSARKVNLSTARGEVQPAAAKPEEVPYTDAIENATQKLEELKRMHEEEKAAEERRRQIEDRKNAFVEMHHDVITKLSSAIPSIDDEIVHGQQQLDDLAKAKSYFSASLEKLSSVRPADWSEQDVIDRSEKFELALEKASHEYEQFLSFQASLHGGKRKARIARPQSAEGYTIGVFGQDLLRGLAFSLPVIITLIIACALLLGSGNA